jgi:hypothetical protein
LTCQTEAFHHLEEEIMIFCHWLIPLKLVWIGSRRR